MHHERFGEVSSGRRGRKERNGDMKTGEDGMEKSWRKEGQCTHFCVSLTSGSLPADLVDVGLLALTNRLSRKDRNGLVYKVTVSEVDNGPILQCCRPMLTAYGIFSGFCKADYHAYAG